MIVPYTKFKGKKIPFYRPMITVRLTHKSKSIPMLGLLDSGADKTLINRDLGEQLGIDFNKCQKANMTGISGKSQPTWDTTIKLEVKEFPGVEFQANVCFIDSTFVGLLLGHVGFFEFFDVKFQTLRQQFEIDLAVPPPFSFKTH